MKYVSFAIVLLSALCIPAREVNAGLILALSTPANPSNLAVGASAEIDIKLTGTSGTGALDFLSASVQYDATVFSVSVATVVPGPIVPDPNGFDPSGSISGTVTAFYDDSIDGSAPISQDGFFFSFLVTRIGASASSLRFSSSTAEATSGAFPPIAQGSTLPFAAAPSLAVAEPSSLALVVAGFSCGIGALSLRRP